MNRPTLRSFLLSTCIVALACNNAPSDVQARDTDSPSDTRPASQPAQGKDTDAARRGGSGGSSPQELTATVQANMKQLDRIMTSQMQQGRDVEPARRIILDEFRPLMQTGKVAEAIRVQERVLGMLGESTGAAPEAAASVPAKDVSGSERKADEIQYLVFTPEPRDFQKLETLDKIVGEYVRRMQDLEQHPLRKWGMSVIIPSWTAPASALRAFIGQAFHLAAEHDIAIHFTVESLDWEARSDLWNYRSPGKPGYNADNVNNVEWSDWNKEAFPHRFRDWGTPEQMAPVICYNSPKVLSEVSRIIDLGIGKPLVDGMNLLKSQGEEDLFAGITVGSEPELPNYENIGRINPNMARLMDDLNVPRSRLGYCALTNLGYSQKKPPSDFAAALADVNRSYVEYWAKEIHKAGVPKTKMYTHIAAGAGVVGSPGVEHTNAPIDVAFNDYSRPGWTTYPNGPLSQDFSLLYEALAEHGNPHWGGTEANPQGLASRGMPMDAYLDRHYDHGATLVVLNVGATSEAMMDRLRDGVWGDEAMAAYRQFLAGR